MITRNTPLFVGMVELQHHAITHTELDMNTGVFSVTVGSWASEAAVEIGCPATEVVLQVRYTEWIPEYYQAAESMVQQHPDWTGEGPARPSAHHVFDWTAKQWIDPRTLRDLKDSKWEDVKRWRTQAGIDPLMTTRFGIFDAAVKDMANIKDTVAGLTAAAALGAEPASIRWTMADNNPERYVTLTPNELREIGVMLLTRGNAAHEHSRALYDQIEAATTPEQLQAIGW